MIPRRTHQHPYGTFRVDMRLVQSSAEDKNAQLGMVLAWQHLLSCTCRLELGRHHLRRQLPWAGRRHSRIQRCTVDSFEGTKSHQLCLCHNQAQTACHSDTFAAPHSLALVVPHSCTVWSSFQRHHHIRTPARLFYSRILHRKHPDSVLAECMQVSSM